MSSLSIVVPRLGADDHFESTLASILRYRMPHHQVVVIQSDLQADTYGLEDEVKFVEVAGKPSLARYFNFILSSTQGETIHLIRPGVEVTHQWFAHGIRPLCRAGVGAVAAPLVNPNHRGEVVSAGIQPTRLMTPRHLTDVRDRPMGPSVWAGFYRRRFLEVIGPVDESLGDAFLGLDLAFSLRAVGWSCGVMADRLLTIADPRMLNIPIRQQTGYDAQRMIRRHLIRDHQPWAALVAMGGDLVTGLVRPSRWTQVAGRCLARRKQATDRAYGRHLAVARLELAGEASELAKPKKRSAA